MRIAMITLCMTTLALASGCAGHGIDRWSATHVATAQGFAVPESVAIDPATGSAYVSNIDAATAEDYWQDDGRGSIAALAFDGGARLPVCSTFAEHDDAAPLHSPKGLCLDGASLWSADNRHLRWHALDGSGEVASIAVPGAQRLNDVAGWNGAIYVSDTAAGVVHRIDADGQCRTIPAPAGVNGITFTNGRMLAVSWTEHDIYELDPSGRKPPRAWGLARHFKNLDGIEALDDATLIVSDFTGNAVWLVAADASDVRRLIEIETPADIGLDSQRGRLFIPQFMSNRVAIYELRRTGHNPTGTER